MPRGNIDLGATITSFIGLILLGSVFVAIGQFCSLITENNIVAFLSGLFLSYVFYRGFADLSILSVFYGTYDHFIASMGIHAHYQAIQKGVIESREIIYFISLIIFFLSASKLLMQKRFW